MKHVLLHIPPTLLFFFLTAVQPAEAQVVNSEWNTANGNWNVPVNWFPNDTPDNGGGFTYNVTIGNRAVAAGALVTFVPEDGTSDTVSTLTLSNGADLFTNSNQLVVPGLTTVNGAGTTIRVEEHATAGTTALQTLNLNLLSGGGLDMSGGIAAVTGAVSVGIGSVVGGYGTINAGDTDAVVEKAFENSGLLQPQSNSAAPQTLTLHANGVDTLDLDGNSDAGVVDVSNAFANVNVDTVTLVVDGPLSDAFDGTLQIGQRDTVQFNDNFSLTTGAAVQMDGGTSVATLTGAGAATSIAGTAMTITGDAVIDNDLTFTGTANTITVNATSSLTLNGDVTLPDASAISLTSTSELIVGGHLTVSEAAGDFNWDGPGAATTTVRGSGTVTLSVNRVDTSDDIYGGTLNLEDGGDVTVNVAGTSWTMAGTLIKNKPGTSTLSGDHVIVTGAILVNGGQLILPQTTLQASANVTVDGTLLLGSASVLSGPAAFTGVGTVRTAGTSTVAANTTVAVNTFDWDGTTTGNLHTINDGVIFAITSPNFDTDGDMDDSVSLGGNGAQLIVSGPAQWTMTGTLTANAAAAGTAAIGGTSRLVLAGTTSVDGNTNVSAPLTFGAGSTTSIDAAMTLDVIGSTANYEGGAITGAGTYDPSGANTVTANTSITTTNFDFDGGSWTVPNDVLLTINVADYEPDSATNTFEGTITLQDGDISVTTGDAEFVMNGTLNMSAAAGFIAAWTGKPLDIGNDAGSLDANVNITGQSQSQMGSPVDFNSDADVDIAAGATLAMLGTVNFDTVNGANNAEFTGAGRFVFSAAVNVNEAVTLNMPGGIVDLDGLDGVGDFINIDAPFTINAGTMSSFGKTNSAGGVNTLDINHSTGTGRLTVNLDNTDADWTLNGPGVLNLTAPPAIPEILLAGSTVVLSGTVNVNGRAGVTARTKLRGIANVVSGALIFQGGTPEVPNTIEGGAINGPGEIQAPALHALRGFGTINAPVNFSAAADLVAADGLLDVNGSITGIGGVLGVDASGVLDLASALSTSQVAGGIAMNGGTLQGAAVTTSTVARAIFGRGTVTSQVTNLGALRASGGTLVFTNNLSDWDGTASSGSLRADAGATLELQDNTQFFFSGSVVALQGGRVFANGFGLDFNSGSSLQLTGGTYESTHTTDLGRTVTVNAGADSTIKVRDNFVLQFKAGAVTTLNGNLVLDNNTIQVRSGATFSGTGALIVAPGSGMVTDPNVNINVLLDNRGAIHAGGFNDVGRADVRDYQQSSGGELFMEITGTALNQFDRLVVNGAAQVHGHLNLDIDGGFVPTVGQSFDVITATGGVSGKFDVVLYSGLPIGLGFDVTYLSNAVRVTVAPQSAYDKWMEDRVLEAQNQGISVGNLDRAKGSDFDRDGLTNIGEFALNGHPFIGSRSNKVFPKVAFVGGSNVLTLTIPVRNGVVPDPSDPAVGELLLKQVADVLTYKIQAGDVLTNAWSLGVTEVTGAAATAIQSGLPPPDAGWTYRTFRSPGSVAGDPGEYMRVVITE